ERYFACYQTSNYIIIFLFSSNNKFINLMKLVAGDTLNCTSFGRFVSDDSLLSFTIATDEFHGNFFHEIHIRIRMDFDSSYCRMYFGHWHVLQSVGLTAAKKQPRL